MSTVPTMVLPGATLTATTLHAASFYHPANPGDSLEILNGDMTSVNYAGAAGSIAVPAIQPGAFVVGRYEAIEQWEFCYGKQLVSSGSGTDINNRARLRYGLTFQLPWTASLVMVWYQMLCRQDAIEYSAGLPARTVEYWNINLSYDGSIRAGLYAQLPHTRSTVDPTGTSPWVNDPGMSQENRWRYVSRCQMQTAAAFTSSVVAPGQHHIVLSAWASLFAPDLKSEKVVIPGGGLGFMAFRA